MSAVFSLREARVQFGRPARPVIALEGLTLQIAAGERVALVGANGCGKSTMLRLLHGLLPPSAGTVVSDPALRQAMLFQRPYLLRMSVLSNIALALWLRGQPWTQARLRARAALQRAGLQGLSERPAHRLSAGQQQRVALVRASALQPQVLLLDEPTASLDPHAKRDVESMMREFSTQDAAVTMIFSSHNLGQVKRLASRVIYLEQGRMLADLAVRDFFGDALLQRQYAAAHLFVKGELV
jgi:tungstate transport system ATP-binding protein